MNHRPFPHGSAPALLSVAIAGVMGALVYLEFTYMLGMEYYGPILISEWSLFDAGDGSRMLAWFGGGFLPAFGAATMVNAFWAPSTKAAVPQVLSYYIVADLVGVATALAIRENLSSFLDSILVALFAGLVLLTSVGLGSVAIHFSRKMSMKSNATGREA